MKKYLFILPFLLLSFYLAPRAYATELFNFTDQSVETHISAGHHELFFKLGHPLANGTGGNAYVGKAIVNLSDSGIYNLVLYGFSDAGYSVNVSGNTICTINAPTAGWYTLDKTYCHGDSLQAVSTANYYGLNFYESNAGNNQNGIKTSAGSKSDTSIFGSYNIEMFSGMPYFCVGDNSSTDCGATPPPPGVETITPFFPTNSSTVPWFDHFLYDVTNLSSTNPYRLIVQYQDLNNLSQQYGPIFRYMLDHDTSTSWRYEVQQYSIFPNLQPNNDFYVQAFLQRDLYPQVGFHFWSSVAVATSTFHIDLATVFPTSTNYASITFSNLAGNTQFGAFAHPSSTIQATSTESICGIPVDNIPSGLAWAGCKIMEFAFVPGRLTNFGIDGPGFLKESFYSLKTVPPFIFFFSTMDDVKNILNTVQASTTLSIQVPMPGHQGATTTDIVIASPTFGRDTAGEKIWAQYTNLFILGTGVLSISGIISYIFFL